MYLFLSLWRAFLAVNNQLTLTAAALRLACLASASCSSRFWVPMRWSRYWQERAATDSWHHLQVGLKADSAGCVRVSLVNQSA